ncbi:MAG: hypothetical protein ISS36_03425 [Candidatus Aenigmarchaeota archaeon]|nr:hypothetical protein [Candidatus Aenigmarchaeota archaeon]
MRMVRNFENFINNGVVKKQSPDFSRAEFLENESGKSFQFLRKIINDMGVNEENTNSIIKLCYDIIMELIRAKMLRKGFNSSGHGAHEAEVSFLRKLDFNENEIQFADQLRYFRNGIIYYGKSFDAEYGKKVVEFLEKIHERLK